MQGVVWRLPALSAVMLPNSMKLRRTTMVVQDRDRQCVSIKADGRRSRKRAKEIVTAKIESYFESRIGGVERWHMAVIKGG